MSRLSESSEEETQETLSASKKSNLPDTSFSSHGKKRKKHDSEEEVVTSLPKRKKLKGGIDFSKSSYYDENDSDHSSESKSSKKKDAHKAPVSYGVGAKILKQLGYVDGGGLGKSGQGRAEPISASTQHGRRGLGFIPSSQGKPYDGSEWDPREEIINLHDKPEWLEETDLDELDRETLDSWIVTGKQKLFINDENTFCDPKILEDILSLKTVFDDIKPDMLHTLVGRCNLYESIKNVFFINRAALKMANMDAVFDFMFTNPMTEDNVPMVQNNQLLYFADVCAGPGGFTEYVLWRKKWYAKGFGFTLKEQSDFNLIGMHAASTESFYPYYGVNDDGNIFDPSNLESLKKFVLQHSENKGVHFLMGDGGFSVEGEENIQEIKSKQLYLCQCIAALSVVRDGGHFVVKLFDIFTKFSVGLIYLMYRSFKQICIYKPVTSRPANSERYLICKWKKKSLDTIERHLFDINSMLTKFSDEKSTTDIIELVPLEVLMGNRIFFEYICRSNNSIGRAQIFSLLKIKGLNNDRTLLDSQSYHSFYGPEKLSHEEKKADIRKKCLELWKIPDEPKKKDDMKRISNYNDQLHKILRDMIQFDHNCITENVLSNMFKYQSKTVMSMNDLLENGDSGRSSIKSVQDWYFVFCNNIRDVKSNFYLSLGRNVYKLEGKTWRYYSDLSLPDGSLILAELVEEKRGSGRGSHSSHSLHVLDAVRLGHEFIFNQCLKSRYKKIKLFCEAINKPINKNSENVKLPLRSKNLYKLCDIHVELGKLTERILKNSKKAMTTPVPNLKENNDTYFAVENLMFFRYTKDPWITVMSRSNTYEYFYNTKINISVKDLTPEMFGYTFDSFLSSFRCPFSCNKDYSFLLHDNLKK